jgi:DNA polymerase III delta subunit
MSRIYIGSINLVKAKLKDEFPNKKLIFVDRTEENSLSFSVFFDTNKIFLHINPNIDSLKIIASDVEKQRGIHFLYYEEDNFDGRNSLIQSIKKSGNIFDVSFPLFGDVNNFKRHLNNYLSKKEMSITSDAMTWITSNPPILRIKSKAANNKKELLVYDLDLLFQEIDKISSYSKTINVEDFSNCLFKSETDIFDFIESIFEKDIDKVLQKYEEMIEAVTDQGLLMILLYQLHFLLVCSDCKEKNIYNSETVLSMLELEDILGKYFDSDYKSVSYTKKSQNPIRVKIEMNKKRDLSSQNISYMIEQVVNTIVDLRDFGNKDYALPFLFHKLVTV